MQRRMRSSLSLERGLGAPTLFAIAYAVLGSSIYFALGVVADRALGLTPVVFLAAGLLFALTIMTYVEGATLHPEPGGSSVMARYAFNEFWSFVAGWAILLDYVILIAIAAQTVPAYLTPFWAGFDEASYAVPIGIAVIVVIAAANVRGFGTRARRFAIRLSMIDLVVQLAVVALGLALVFDSDALVREIDLGTAPTWRNLIYAAVIATIAYTGIEAASNLAPEVDARPHELGRVVSSGTAVVLTVFVGMAVVALMSVPAVKTPSGVKTALGGEFQEAPVLGVVGSYEPAWVANVLKWVVSVVAALVLVEAVNAAMLGVTRLSYALSTNRQIPSSLARLHPRWSTPFLAVGIFAALAAALVVPHDLNFLVGLYAFGAMLAFTLAHLSICVLRYREPDAPRAFRVPFNVTVAGRPLPVPAVIAGLVSFAAWISVIVLHEGARFVGGAWLLFGIAFYLVYRRVSGKSVTERVSVEPEALKEAPDVEFGSILVPIFGTTLDDDIMGTAGRLASAESGEHDQGARIRAMYVLKVPVSLPLNAELPREQVREAERALERAKRIGEEYQGVEVLKRIVRARDIGAAIVSEASRLGVEAIILGGEEPSRMVGGSRLGGVVPNASRFAGPITSYVVEKAPCRVLLTAPPLPGEDDSPAGNGAAAAAGPGKPEGQ